MLLGTMLQNYSPFYIAIVNDLTMKLLEKELDKERKILSTSNGEKLNFINTYTDEDIWTVRDIFFTKKGIGRGCPQKEHCQGNWSTTNQAGR